MLIYNFRSVDIFAIVFLTLMLQHLRRGYIHYQNTTKIQMTCNFGITITARKIAGV